MENTVGMCVTNEHERKTLNEWVSKKAMWIAQKIFLHTNTHAQSSTNDWSVCLCVCVYAYAKWFYSMVCERVCVCVCIETHASFFQHGSANSIFWANNIIQIYARTSTHTHAHAHIHWAVVIAWFGLSDATKRNVNFRIHLNFQYVHLFAQWVSFFVLNKYKSKNDIFASDFLDLAFFIIQKEWKFIWNLWLAISISN